MLITIGNHSLNADDLFKMAMGELVFIRADELFSAKQKIFSDSLASLKSTCSVFALWYPFVTLFYRTNFSINNP